MTERRPTGMPNAHEADLDRVIHDWLAGDIEPLPSRIKDEVVVQASVVGQRGRWPWQRRHSRLRVDTLSLGFAPLAVVVLLAAAAISLAFLFLQPTDETLPLPATSPTPVESPLATPFDSTAGFTFEDVEPGVRRLIDDGTGYEAPLPMAVDSWPVQLTAAPDGTVWFSRHGGDGAIVGLGVPQDVPHPVGRRAGGFEFEQNGRLWAVADGIAWWDGADWAVQERIPGSMGEWPIAAHPDGGVVAAVQRADGTEFWRFDATASDPAPFATFLPERGSDPDQYGYSRPTDLAVTTDRLAWLIEPRFHRIGIPYVREPSRLLRSDGGAWEEVRPLGESALAEPLAMTLDPAGKLVVHFAETIVDPDSPADRPWVEESYGDRRWIARWDGSEWAVGPSRDGTGSRPGTLLAADRESVWMSPPWDGSSGIEQYRADGTRTTYLDGISAFDAVVTRDGNVWVAGTDTALGDDTSGVDIYVITPQAIASAATGASGDATAHYVLEPEGPRVQRFVDDGAGHGPSDLPTSWKWLYKLTTAPDGTVWIPRLDEILHLGEEGFVENPIGPGALELDIDLDGDLWIRNGSEVLTPDGSVLGKRRSETDPRTVEMVRHPDGGVIASLTYPDDRNELRRWTRGMDGLGELVAPPLSSEGTDWSLVDTEVAADRTIWAIELRYWAETQERLPARLVRTVGDDWEVVPLAEVGEEVEPWAIGMTPDGRLLVDLVASGSAPGRASDERLPLDYEGADRWLGELAAAGDWVVTPIDTSEDVPWRVMTATTTDGAWFALGDVETRCHGVGLLDREREERYLTDKCVHSLAAAPDDRVWVIASDHGGYTDIDEPQLYVIAPHDEVQQTDDAVGGT